MKKRLILVLVGLIALATLAAAPPASAQDNAAVAVNTKDGANVFKFAFDIRRVMGDVVEHQNAAVAYANCEDCQTVAVAIQIVLVFSDPSVVSPENYAIALNEECDTCETVAGAFQFVLSVPDRFKFSKQAWQRIIEIRQEIRELGRDFKAGELTALDLEAQVEALVNELRTVIKEDIKAGGARGHKDDDDDGDDDVGDDDDRSGPDDPTVTDETTTDVETGETDTSPTETAPTETTTTP